MKMEQRLMFWGVIMAIVVTAGLLFRKGKLLITQRPPGKHLAGFWEFPGGKQDLGETLEECLVRELKEELGVQVIVEDLIEKTTHTYPEKTVELNFFRCKLVAGEPQELECSAHKWVTAGELDNFKFPPPDYGVVEKLKQNPGLWK